SSALWRMPARNGRSSGFSFGRAFGFSPPVSGGCLVQVADQFGRVRVGLRHAAGLDVGVGQSQSSVNDAALSRRVLAVGRGELGAINHQLGSDDSAPILQGQFNQAAIAYAHSFAEAPRKGHLAFTVNFYESGHGAYKTLIVVA